jgi:hypothetical protein
MNGQDSNEKTAEIHQVSEVSRLDLSGLSPAALDLMRAQPLNPLVRLTFTPVSNRLTSEPSERHGQGTDPLPPSGQ